MKIALISDIHANLPALRAVLESIEHHKPDAIYCLGDLVGYNVWPNEVIHEIRKRGIATLAGNHDLKVKRGEPDKEVVISGKAYGYSIVGEDEKDYLLTLPAHIRLEFRLNNEKLNMLFVHGSPRSVDEYMLEDMEESLLTSIMQDVDADVICCGHSHKPYHRITTTNEQGTIIYKHAINIGSVGKPKDKDPRACYVLLHTKHSTTKLDANSFKVEFVRVDYDIEKAARAIEESPLPDEFADKLRQAN